MSGLVLKLAPKERVLINGAVIENGDRRSRLAIITPNANILRLKDAINPYEVTTPVRRLCYLTQLILSGNNDPISTKDEILRGIREVGSILKDENSQKFISNAMNSLSNDRFYQALKSLRFLLSEEKRVLEASRK